MSTVPKFFHELKDQKEYYPNKIWKTLLIFLIIILALVITFFFTPLFKINKIEVLSSDSDIGPFFDIYKGKNLFLIDPSQTKADIIKNFPEILDLQISKGIPNMLRIKVTEDTPKMVWQTNGVKYFVDEEGIVYKKVEGDAPNLPLIVDNKNLPVEMQTPVVISSFVNFVTEIINKFNGTDLQVQSFEVNETSFQVTAVTKNNIKIIFDTTRPVQDQVVAAEKVYTEHKAEVTQYMDVRVEGKVYYQ